MTFEEFMEWCDDDTNVEWVDGEIVWMSPVSLDNGDLTQFLAAPCRRHLSQRTFE
jgi:Uma2 family endonuclease